jgi:hypothetical protein
MFRRIFTGTSCLVATALFFASHVSAQDKPATPAAAPAPPYAAVLKDAKAVPGLLQLHQKGNSLHVELMPGDYGSEFIVLISIARGIGEGQLLGGMSWGFGDDWLWQFRKVDDNIHVVRRNIRFRAPREFARKNRRFASPTRIACSTACRSSRWARKGGDPCRLLADFHERLAADQHGVQPGFSRSRRRSRPSPP